MSKIENSSLWLDMFSTTMKQPSTVVRGSLVKELFDFTQCLNTLQPFMNFKGRNINIDYFKKEMLWKLTGDPFNDSIKQHAKMWEFVQNTDGTFNSNYGQYWFGKQQGLIKAFLELTKDMYSRRSIIPMLNASHIGHGVNDTVCTGFVQFYIRQSVNGMFAVNMHVSMRSSDQIFGLGTDIPTFAFLHRLMHGILQSVYPNVYIGDLIIHATNSHIYERHFGMVNQILNDSVLLPTKDMPIANTREAFNLIACQGVVDSSWGELSEWLMS